MPGDQLRDLTLQLPPGLAGNPQAVPKCSLANFNADTCAAGVRSAPPPNVTIAALLSRRRPGNGLQPGAQPGRGGTPWHRPAPRDRRGLGNIYTQVGQTQARRPGAQLDHHQPATAAALAWGADRHQLIDLVLDESFASNPTSCNQATTTFVVRSYAAPTTDVTGTASFTPTGCENLAFTPQASLLIDGGAQLRSPG